MGLPTRCGDGAGCSGLLLVRLGSMLLFGLFPAAVSYSIRNVFDNVYVV